jgi:hypothetical protein
VAIPTDLSRKKVVQQVYGIPLAECIDVRVWVEALPTRAQIRRRLGAVVRKEGRLKRSAVSGELRPSFF